MFVTCYYDIYNNPSSFMNYIYLFYDLASSGIPIIVFTDPSFVSKFRIFPNNVKVIPAVLESFELYNIAIKYDRELPKNRTAKKDTKEFLALMNTKINFIKRASEIVKAETYFWIDFGILKIIKDTDKFINRLRILETKQFLKTTIPGCWGANSSFSCDSVSWRFCGGFVIVPEKDVNTFYNHCKNVLTDFCNFPQYKLTWETNIWHIVDSCTDQNFIQWYSGDHDDTIIPKISNL